jgi:hypothetical protein
MPDRTLANLRRKRVYIHKQLDRWEPLVARLRASLAETEAAIQAIRPELQLHPRRYGRNPYFARGELPRVAMDVMREAGEPLAVRTIAVRALAAKGIALPDPRAMRWTRLRLQQVMARWQAKGVVRTVGSGRETRRELVEEPDGLERSRTQLNSKKYTQVTLKRS